MAGERRPLGAGLVTLIVIDAVLVLVLAVLFVQRGPLRLGGPGDDQALGDATASPTFDPAEVVAFASPTRNIGCTISPIAANCEIAHYMYATPTLEGCSGSVGNEIEVTAESAHWVCRTGSPPPSPSADVANLDWGDSISEHGFTCTSENDGVTCTHDETGHTFSLARRVVSLG
jgi:hypothetical protein